MEFTCSNNNCDNCRQRIRMERKDVPIKDIMLKILTHTSAISNFTQFTRVSVAALRETIDTLERQRYCILLDYEERRETSLLNYLFRVIQPRGNMTIDRHLDEWRNKLGNEDVSFFLRLSSEAISSLIPTIADHSDHQNSQECRVLEVGEFSKRSHIIFPHIVQYLTQLMHLPNYGPNFERKVMIKYKTNIIEAINLLYTKKNLRMPDIYKKVEQKNGALDLFFTCKFPVDAASEDVATNLVLMPPQKVFGKRIYRLLKAERFLEITVGPTVSVDRLLKLQQFWKFGRFYRYLWCSKHKSPQAFIFFAEQGVGIAKDDELAVEDVMRQCIPEHDNPHLKISQFSKRMKLAFSTTIPGPSINSKILVMLPNFDIPGVEEIDGAGVISQGALELIREHCRKNGSLSSTSNDLDYTGFQGRIGG
jgi:RNA dependent RNA polymerase